MNISPQFVDFVPDNLSEGILYVCMRYHTASHLCCCGCGKEVVTPITPADWSISRRGNKVTLHPSIGNWNFPCQSHYLIQNNQIVWARQMSAEQIQAVQNRDRVDKEAYIAYRNQQKSQGSFDIFSSIGRSLYGIWTSLLRFFK